MKATYNHDGITGTPSKEVGHFIPLSVLEFSCSFLMVKPKELGMLEKAKFVNLKGDGSAGPLLPELQNNASLHYLSLKIEENNSVHITGDVHYFPDRRKAEKLSCSRQGDNQ